MERKNKLQKRNKIKTNYLNFSKKIHHFNNLSNVNNSKFKKKTKYKAQ